MHLISIVKNHLCSHNYNFLMSLHAGCNMHTYIAIYIIIKNVYVRT